MSISEHAWGKSPGADRVWAQVAGLRPSESGARLFMVLQAYIDDSVDDDGTFVLAGYISTAEKWAAFSKEWEAALPSATLNERDEHHFKMSEMAMSPERMSRVNVFHNIIGRHVLMSIHVVFNRNDLPRAMNRIWIDSPVGTEIRIGWGDWESPYFMAHRALMDVFHEVRLKQPEMFPLSEVVDFYFDETTEKGPLIQSWDEQMARLTPEHRAMYGSMPRFEDDRKFLPIQAADFRAWWVRKWAREHGYKKIGDGEYPFLTEKRTRTNLGISADEEELVKRYMSILTVNLAPGTRINDRGPSDPVDPPPPLSRLVKSLRRLLWKAKPPD